MNSSPTPRTSRLLQASALAAAALFLAAGCSKTSDTSAGTNGGPSSAAVTTTSAASSGYGKSPSSSAGATSGSSAAAGAAMVATATTPVGSVLVDAKGMTLYVFDKDTGTTSACKDACAKAWPPATATGTPAAANLVDQSKLGTTKRDDGSTQITYAGHPLYTYAMDTKPGDVTGQGVGGIWWVIGADGTKIDKKA